MVIPIGADYGGMLEKSGECRFFLTRYSFIFIFTIKIINDQDI